MFSAFSLSGCSENTGLSRMGIGIDVILRRFQLNYTLNVHNHSN
jgi:hypothetical protein